MFRSVIKDFLLALYPPDALFINGFRETNRTGCLPPNLYIEPIRLITVATTAIHG